MKRVIILNLILILLSSCSGKDKKEVYNPKAVEQNNNAVAQMQKLNNDSAFVLFDKAIEIDKSYYLPHANKAGIYVGKKEFGKALAEIEIAIAKNPDYAEGWAFAGILYHGLGDTLAAKKYFEKSVEVFDEKILNPDENEQLIANRISRSVSLILLGRENEGKDELRKLKTEDPDNIVLDEFLKRGRQDFLNDIFINE